MKRLFWSLAVATTACGARPEMAPMVPPAPIAPAPSPVPDLGPRPDLAPAPAFQPPVPQVLNIAGLPTVWLLERHGLPLVAVRVVVSAGAADDPAGKGGLAALTAEMMEQGAGRYGALEISRLFDQLGAKASVEAGQDASEADVTVLKGNLKRALELLGDVVSRPRFETAEWDRAKALWLDQLKARPFEPNDLASVVSRAVYFGESHPYGHPLDGNLSTVGTLTLADAKAFHKAHWRPDRATLVIVGDVSVDDLKTLFVPAFANWVNTREAPALLVGTPPGGRPTDSGTPPGWRPTDSGTPPGGRPTDSDTPPGGRPTDSDTPPGGRPTDPREAPLARTSFTPTPPKGPWPRTVLVDRPGAAQTVFAFVAPGPTEADPAVPALRLANIPLGGSFTSRLNTNLREDKGYTYGVHSGLATARIAGRWGIRTSVESGVTSPALKELLKEVSGMAKDGPTSAELGKARASEKGDRVSSYESIEDMAHGLSALASMSLPADWDAQLARRTDTLPDTDVVAAAKGMSLQQATIVAVGDGTVIRAAFEAAGLPAPEVRDVDGRPATAGAPSPGVKK